MTAFYGRGSGNSARSTGKGQAGALQKPQGFTIQLACGHEKSRPGAGDPGIIDQNIHWPGLICGAGDAARIRHIQLQGGRADLSRSGLTGSQITRARQNRKPEFLRRMLAAISINPDI